ncbi:aminotransferase class I/II-fold pyridoxal phosphate-dependent enzyme [Leifsonia sp. H3M29-4]|uniref:MalY/PatB family protein n=1 Tax=Salinibacterium metalliresistens TaxID=3031321 RepID=UPI0023DA6CBB|nr:aminotransferase class I/II-fold pyridoxal phosphate-dependent enzyme [Salinibacterium metalliresistens]MDF1477910.1 aminotransferase class I/II-fold pyridoxal phosphate-dependent enzyme [Salinibacterium metalliresistens]
MSAFAQRVNAITIDELRSTGATKWSATDGSIGAFVAEMDFGIDPHVTAALHTAVDDGAFGYMPARIAADLSDATSEFLERRYGWQVAPSDVRAIPDVIMGLELAMEHCSTPGSKIIVPTPAYMPFLMVPPMRGREVIEMPLAVRDGRYEFDLDELQRAFDQGGNLLVLCNPYNPVGRVFAREELVAISEVVARNGGRVFSDEIWAPLVYSGSVHVPYATVSPAAADHTITAMSASKAWNLPGLKCAELVLTSDRDRETWDRIGMFAGHGTSNLGAIANAAAFRRGDPWLDDLGAYLESNRDRLLELVAEELPGAWMPRPEGTYVGWIDFRDTRAGERPAEFFAREASIALTEGTMCGVAGTGFARLIFATPQPILEHIVRALGESTRRTAAA